MVWFEISTTRGRSLPTGNHYAPRPANKPDVISKYFCVSDKNHDTNNHNVLRIIISVLLTFNGCAICLTKLSILCKIKGDAICTSTCSFGFIQYVQNDPVSAIPIRKHAVCCLWCCQADCWHRILTIDIVLYLHDSTSHH